MSLNIKKKETHKLAARVAKLTGESMTEAVTQALQERLERLESSHEGGLAERLAEIGRDSAKHVKEPFKSMNPDDLLYDDMGLPK